MKFRIKKRVEVKGPPTRQCKNARCNCRGLSGLNGCGCESGQSSQPSAGFSFDRDTKWILLIGAFGILLSSVKRR